MNRHTQLSETAFALWQQRGCPAGSPEIDWAAAEREWAAPKSDWGTSLIQEASDIKKLESIENPEITDLSKAK